MKNLLIACLFFPVFTFAQEITPVVAKEAVAPKNEFGINLVSANGLTGYWNENGTLKLITDLNVPNGIYYKRHLGNNALRFSVNYAQHVEFYKGDPSSHGSAFSRELMFNAGAEHTFGTNKKLQFYAFTELNFSFSETKSNVRTSGDNSYSSYVRALGPGLTAGMGVRYNPTKNLTLFYEANVMVNYTRVRFSNYQQNQYSSSQFRINPGTFGIGFRF